MDELELLKSLGVAAGLGLLVGLQREWRDGEADIAGIRTFALITLLGAVAAMLGATVTAAGLIGIVVFFLMGNLARFRNGQFDSGITTEVAGVLMYCVGALLMHEHVAISVVAAGAIAVLLHFKPQIHSAVDRISVTDFRGIIQLVLIGLVILPVLPDQAYGPYKVLNPYRIWLMVVLIVGISLAAYAAYRILGSRVGAILGGILGGFISSTATTVSYARQTKNAPETALLAALVILIASTIVNIRVLIEIAAVSRSLLMVAALPIGVMLAVMVVLSVLLFLKAGHRGGLELDHENPAQLKAALIFGALYAVIIFIVATVKENFGEDALYVVAVISGLTDVDAMTLSTARMVATDRVSADTGWRVIMVAMMANLVFKGAAAAMLGNLRLAKWVAVVFGASLAVGVAIILLWPAAG